MAARRGELGQTKGTDVQTIETRPMKMWSGQRPMTCAFCGQQITTSFCDGQTRTGHWYQSCLSCGSRQFIKGAIYKS